MIVYKLKFPVDYADAKVTEIEVRRPKGKHIKKIGSTANLGNIMEIAAHITDYTPRFFDELDAVDYIGLSEVIGDFLGDGQ